MNNNNDANINSAKLTSRPATIQFHTNQDCDSDNELLSSCNHENRKYKDDNDNNKQSKEEYPEIYIAHDNKKSEPVDRT